MKEIKNWLQATKPKLTWLAILVLPFSSNYKLEGYSLGSAGGAVMNSGSYEMVGSAGELSNSNLSGGSYDLGAGLAFIRQANVPTVATFDNPDNYYDKLHFVIGTSGNPSDTKYAVAISPDNFTTTYYVKSDNTIGLTLAPTDYQTYAVWGGAAGTTVIGLVSGTTYKMKIKARQGKFTETGWGPKASADTLSQALTFDIDVSAIDEETAAPYSINLGSLTPDSVVSSNEKIWIDLGTNTSNGASVYVYGQNAGLYSLTVGSTIAAVSGNLATLPKGFGVQGVGATEASGGPLTIDSLYDLSGDIVGKTDTVVRQIFLTTNPVTTGRARFMIKAKTDISIATANDYSETLTVVAAAHY
jgi:hypothetical protein